MATFSIEFASPALVWPGSTRAGIKPTAPASMTPSG
eukprot:CAMPEP_0203953596 /NCGR_PEP_ID=MMETSP0359-20131031/86924_1 /ASSEMBLY_ACC=CAM_ASM_000338 /TAXON_ID=268821 /ORGANISM="Scrippsiella Hangoei, Strain SHTV-5" /LENGTH=35 /DNA_ID= /DNA_START= /DNA_END= /DNA_ORIENTATION=